MVARHKTTLGERNIVTPFLTLLLQLILYRFLICSQVILHNIQISQKGVCMKSKYTSDYKCDLLNNGYYEEYKKLKKELYHSMANTETQLGEIVKVHSFESLNKQDFYNCITEYNCMHLLDRSLIRKRKKVKDKISELVLSGNAIFVTLTFTDDMLSKTSIETRRRYVARYLKKYSSDYVANIDFGTKNEREHYHAVVSNDLDLSKWKGMINVERVRSDLTDIDRIKHYITKLSLHALKKSTTSVLSRLIYSRGS